MSGNKCNSKSAEMFCLSDVPVCVTVMKIPRRGFMKMEYGHTAVEFNVLLLLRGQRAGVSCPFESTFGSWARVGWSE